MDHISVATTVLAYKRVLTLAAVLSSALLLGMVVTRPTQIQSVHPVANVAARASLPADRLHFGLGNDPGSQSWITGSGVPWRYRYTYLAGGVNNGNGTDPCGPNVGWQTWNSPAGQYATYYIDNSTANSYIPVLTYYEIVHSNPSPGNESALLTKIGTTCTMQRYWADFTVLMQRVGASGATVVVHVEPDFWGNMEQQNPDPRAIPAVVASSGNADLAGLPNTVAGMGLAFLRLRDRYAPNALLAIHASSWASSVDIATDQRSTIDPAAEADKVVAFINKAGLVGNPSGITPWDVVFNDVADHDAGSYGALSNTHWWDRNNVLFPNFSRWLAFMSRIHTDTGLPLIEWQVPVGNQYFDTMNNTDGHYQDNRAEYFLAHPTQLTAAGIVAVLFGKANAGQTNYTDDKGDGITNPAPVSSYQCNGCNNHVSTVSDDDGGYLRMAVGLYYRSGAATPCTSIAVSASPVSPRPSGTQITVTGSASGCPNAQYEFWARWQGSTSWQLLRGYSSTATYVWNSTGALTGTEQFGVWARDASSLATYDTFNSLPYSVNAASCSGLTISAAPPNVAHGAGTHVTLAGVASGCPNTPQYEFWMRAASQSSWQLVRPYGAGATYDWNTTGALAGIVYFGVWVRDSSSSAAYDFVGSTPVTVS